MSQGAEFIDWKERVDCADKAADFIQKLSPPAAVYFLGGPDTGKTTLAGKLAARVGNKAGCEYLDADPGQSAAGPPSTIGLTGGEILSGKPASPTALRFIGTTSPSYNPGPSLDSLGFLSRLGSKRADYLFIDSPGYIAGEEGCNFQFRSIMAAGPGLVIALEREKELRGVFDKLSETGPGGTHVQKVIILSPSGGVRVKTQAQRRAYREAKFRSYFASSLFQRISLRGRRIIGKIPDFENPQEYKNLLCAVCKEKLLVLSLALIAGYEPDRDCLIVDAPAFSETEAESIIFGRLYIDGRTGKELGKR